MTVSLTATLFALFTLGCLAIGIWLLLHLTALASLARGRADIVPAPVRPRASRRRVAIALAGFVACLAGVLTMQVIVIAV